MIIVRCPTCGAEARCNDGGGLSIPAKAPEWRAVGYDQVHQCPQGHGFLLRRSGVAETLTLQEFAQRFNSSPMAQRFKFTFDLERPLKWSTTWGSTYWRMTQSDDDADGSYFVFAFTWGARPYYDEKRGTMFAPMTDDPDAALFSALCMAMYHPERTE